ncbi:MAG: TonB-dependent receptor [Aquabacterium sp.]|jgi:outer membrane receptor for ferrienterochelin and colicins|nr:MAG: TonB-dependent receptor [Aquabacterium sp.]
MTTPNRSKRLLVAACTLGLASGAQSQPSEEEELAQAYGGQSVVSIATGSSLPLSRAPAVATVITAAEIAAMGATDIDEVLETVPGLHIARSTQGQSPIYVIRGINLGFNPQVLLLVNGVPITAVFAGNRGQLWKGMPLENVARIEVIRGPGSALYGAEAFAGVINVITKTTADFTGTQVGARVGNQRSRDGWMLHGGKWGPVDVSGYLRVGRTDGSRAWVEADAATGWDGLVGTHTSHAPGRMSSGGRLVDGSLDLAVDKLRLRLALRERRDFGAFTGIASALDPTGRTLGQNISGDFTYEDRKIADDWGLSLQASYMHYKEVTDAVLFPAGYLGVYTDGLIGNPYKWEQHYRLNGTATYSGWADHRLRLGLGLEKEEVYKVRETKNFNPDFTPIGTGSWADVTDVSDTAPFMRPHDRTKRYLFVQDEWNLAKDWALTAGLRHDRYSDFGSTTNPRLALVWDAAYNVTAKLLYGTAFRAPSMSELYAINNPVVRGNPDLKPEKMKTLEAAVSWQPVNRLQLGANVFHYQTRDIIRLVNFVYENTGRQNGSGMEFEASWEASKTLKLSGNYSYQHSVDQATDEDAGNAPHHHVYVRADWRLVSGWSLHPQLNWISDRPRVAADTRDALKGYTTVDLTLRTESEGRPWSVSLSVRNLFDADVREPSPYDRTPGQPFISLPYDFPQAGRTFYVQASYTF